MHPSYPPQIENLITAFRKLPGVGPKTAMRYVFVLLRSSEQDRKFFIDALVAVNHSKLVCSKCNHVSGEDPCSYCTDTKRSSKTICVVAEPQDLLAIESTGQFKGQYHVLGGVIRPLDGLKPEQLSIAALERRIMDEKPSEIILALDPDMDGETTLLYLRQRLSKYPLKTTRLARGLPVGGDLEYADEVTLIDAIKGRKEA